ncbi:hypothetical protein AJ79_01791 [Helicocarpus griseus UAMH5409]|uniref:SAP domain-containing protein n=1 Tax=Helicocarpus griseus UAMH5409 TaxID=1447875 RepID=A0A2B7Y5G0_9EURO|nr:hypothetical protein AJ79_01791 [Helicocarpus griseus UAMH5409]
MAAPRSTSIRALRLLAQQHAPTPSAPSSTLASMAPFRRSLHITGAFSAQPARGPDATAIYRSRSLADLRAECERRNLRAGGSKSELVDRLANHDVLQSRAFSIAMRKIDSRPADAASPTRHFNTSRANKAVNDSSTIDFAYMPDPNNTPSASTSPFNIRMPIPPDAYSHYDLTGTSSASSSPMKPEIYAVGGADRADSTSAMSEVVDNHAVEFDPFTLTETVRRSRDAAVAAEKREEMRNGTVGGVARQFWEGIVEDVLGSKGGKVEGRK